MNKSHRGGALESEVTLALGRRWLYSQGGSIKGRLDRAVDGRESAVFLRIGSELNTVS